MGDVYAALNKFGHVICSGNCRRERERLLVFSLLGNPLQLPHTRRKTYKFVSMYYSIDMASILQANASHCFNLYFIIIKCCSKPILPYG